MVIDRKPKKLTEKHVKEIERRRIERVEKRKIERDEKIESARKLGLKEKKKSGVLNTKEIDITEKVEKTVLEEIEFSNEGGFTPGEIESRKGKWLTEPLLEDSAGVCYNKEKDVDLKLSDEGKFKEAFVNGVRLNL